MSVDVQYSIAINFIYIYRHVSVCLPPHLTVRRVLDGGEYLPEGGHVPVVGGEVVDVEALGVELPEADVGRVEPVAAHGVPAYRLAVQKVLGLRQVKNTDDFLDPRFDIPKILRSETDGSCNGVLHTLLSLVHSLTKCHSNFFIQIVRE